MLRCSRFLFLLACFAAGALAQTSTSQIAGTVTDSTGAVVPGASVTATHEATGVASSQTTTSAGIFSFPALPVGPYTISVEMKGFKTSRKTKNILAVNTPLTVDFLLELGNATEVIEVQSAYERLQTTSATIGNVVEHKAVADLPLNGRNPLALLVLEPGVVQRSAGAAGSGIHVNGSRDRAFNVTIDGIEANESTVPNPLSNLYRLNPDNVQEYKVTTSNATAEEGRNSGASISVATRMGSNQFHGTLFEFLRNRALNSNEFFANAQGTVKPDIKLNQYGFEISGPVKKNKTFFFFSWAGQKINSSQPVDQTYGVISMYTPSALAGKFRYFLADPKNPLTIGGQKITRNTTALVDPFTGQYQAGVRDCASSTDLNCVATFNMFANDPRKIGADATVAKLFGSYPLPNSYISGDGLNTATYFWNPPVKVRGPNLMVRLDHTFNENNTVFGRFLLGDQNTLDGDPLNSRPQLFPGFPPMGEVFRKSKNWAVSYRRVFSPRVVNELTAGVSRFVLLFTQGEANPAWPNVPAYARSSGTAFNNADVPYLNTPRTFRAVTTPQLLDNLSIVRGSHVFRTGFNLRFYQHNDQRGQPGGVNVTPVISFSSTIRPPAGFNLPDVATANAVGIEASDSIRLQSSINDILGIPARLSQTFLGDLRSDTFLPFKAGNSVTLWNEGHRMKQYNFYFQDEWRVLRNLTVNYGLRWEINMAPTEAGGRVYVADKPITGGAPVSFVHADTWYQRNNFGAIGPRLGITWSPVHTTVIRTGYGIAFDTVSSFQVTAVAGRVPGLTTSCSSVVGGATTPGCTPVADKRIAEGFANELPAPAVKPSSYLTPPLQTLSNAPGLTMFDPNLKIPTVHQWNLNIQHELPYGFLAQAGYVGRRGTRLFRAYDINQIDAEPLLPSFRIMQANLNARCNPDGSGCPAGVSGQAVPIVTSGVLTSAFVNSASSRSDLQLNAAGTFAGRVEQNTLAAKLRPNQQFATITYLDAGGDSYYHSAQVTLRKRFEAGLLMGLAYTFSKSMDDQSVDPVGSTSGGGLSTTNSRTPTDIRNWRNERGRSDFDRRHVVTTNWVYDLPVGRGKTLLPDAHGIVNHVLGGWSVNGIFTFMSGEPFSVRSGIRTSNYSHESRAVLKGAMPVVRWVEKSGAIGPVAFGDKDPADLFAIPQPGDSGMGRNMFEAPGYWNVDFGLSKRFEITERVRLQFRAEFFNALNHANFDNPRDASSGSPSFRSSVFGQACCATVAPPSTQTIIQTGESARVIQFALKMSF